MQTVNPMTTTPLFLVEVPAEGGNVAQVDIPFIGNTDPVEIDLSPIQSRGHFSAAQTVYINNETGTAEIKLFCETTQQKFSCPAGAQMYMPMIMANPPKLTATYNAAGIIKFMFLNFFLPPAIWFPSATSSGGASSIAVADKSGNTPGAIAANPLRKYLVIENPVGSAANLLVTIDGGGAISLSAGGSYTCDGSSIPDGAIAFTSSGGVIAYTAYEG